jgi:hypothetical protein
MSGSNASNEAINEALVPSASLKKPRKPRTSSKSADKSPAPKKPRKKKSDGGGAVPASTPSCLALPGLCESKDCKDEKDNKAPDDSKKEAPADEKIAPKPRARRALLTGPYNADRQGPDKIAKEFVSDYEHAQSLLCSIRQLLFNPQFQQIRVGLEADKALHDVMERLKKAKKFKDSGLWPAASSSVPLVPNFDALIADVQKCVGVSDRFILAGHEAMAAVRGKDRAQWSETDSVLIDGQFDIGSHPDYFRFQNANRRLGLHFNSLMY